MESLPDWLRHGSVSTVLAGQMLIYGVVIGVCSVVVGTPDLQARVLGSSPGWGQLLSYLNIICLNFELNLDA